MRTSMAAAMLTLALLLGGGCQEAGDPFDPGDPTFARGGNGKGSGGVPVDGDVAALGGSLFNDLALSVFENQSCATCHEQGEGFAASSTAATLGSVVEGSVPGSFGDRKPPSAAYATLAPLFSASGKGATGGNFWDGRATGDELGNPAADQALGPFLNPMEQALPDEACVIWKITTGSYMASWQAVWGNDITQVAFPGNVATTCSTPVAAAGEFVALSPTDRARVETAYHQVALSIAEFEASLNTFSSRFDAGQLSAVEEEGAKLFSSKGKCHQCHEAKGGAPLFTDFAFHNLGVPKNPSHPRYPYGVAAFDPGLGGFTGTPTDLGKFKTPTVRNVARGTHRTYMHNGSLLTLRQVVQFYNTRDVLPLCTGTQIDDPAGWGPDGFGCWPPPEFADNLDTQNMGNLGLTDAEVDAIVAFMMALTDGG